MADRINDRRVESTYPTESEAPHERESKPSAPSRDPATAYARMPDPTGYAAELARYVETHTPRQAASEKTAGPSGARGKSSAESKAMDGVRDRFAGPYVVDGKTVSARPMFRMNVPDAFNARSLKEHLPTLSIHALKEGVHVIELDSSWGAEDGRDFGGFRRDTFLFDPSAKPGEQWSYWSPKNQTFLHGVVGPQGEEVKGCFRPKEKV